MKREIPWLTTPAYVKRLQRRLREKYRVDPETGCWIWTAFTERGRPVVTMKMKNGVNRPYAVVPVIFWVERGKLVPPDRMLRSTCATGASCVNPAHRRAMTQAEFRRSLGLHALTFEQATFVREQVAKRSPESYQSIAREFGVSRELVRVIAQGRSLKQGGPKLTAAQTIEIERRARLVDRYLITRLAAQLRVNVGVLRQLLRRRTYRDPAEVRVRATAR